MDGSTLHPSSRRLRRLAARTRRHLRRVADVVQTHRPKNFPIAYKLALVITLLIASGMGLLGLVIVKNQTQLLEVQMHEFGQTVVSQLSESARELVLSDDTLGLKVLVHNLDANNNILGAAIYSDRGKLLVERGIIPHQDILDVYSHARQLGPGNYTYNWQWGDKQADPIPVVSYLTPIRFQGLMAGHALITFSRSAMTLAIHDAIRAIISATVLMILLGIITAFLIGRRLTKPLHELMDASRAIDEGDFSYRIKERRNDEIGHLMGAFNTMAAGMLEKHQVENAFSRFVSTNVAKQILGNLDHIQLGGKHVRGSVLFADIVGFTSISEQLPPDEVATLLNEYFSYISLASQLYNGTIDKYMGDCAMVVFGVPDKDADHAFHATACGVLIQRLVERLNTQRERDGKIPIHFRIGINSGVMLAGNMGSHERMQYTVVGDSVNLAARLYSVAEQGQVVITEEFYKHPDVAGRIIARRHESIRLRGKRLPVTTYIVRDVATTYRKEMDIQIDTILADKIVA